ncbi:ABC transporter substrate-binding protein [Salinigranum marinum]|uniref:ABC transporter substrate-binding protein n=1 Tax=Salinigranum marinum TaxID=1515595 RepID=UPI002989D116|nr:ABC transporter substrate-binding protein [Salinigranum marinum]
MTNTINRRRVLQTIGAGGVAGLAGCAGGDGGDGGSSDGGSSDGGSSDGGSDESTGTATGSTGGEGPITLGLNFPLSGGLALSGTESARGVELAVQTINANGGVNGREFEIIKRDAQNSDAGVSNVQAFATSDDVDVIIGSFSSSIAKASSEAAARYDKVYWETTGFAPSISEPGYQNVFHSNARTTTYGQLAGRLLDNVIAPALEKPTEDLSLVILYENGEFGSATRDEVNAQQEEYGYEVAEEIGYPAFETSDLSSAIERFKQAEPDVVYHSGYNADTNLFWQQAADLDFYVPACLGNGTAYVLGSFVDAVGSTTAEGIINSSQPHYNLNESYAPGVADILSQYTDEYGETPISQLPNTTYSCMEILAEVARDTASFSPADVESAVLDLDIPFGELANGFGASYDEEYHRNERVRVAGMQWQPDTFTEDTHHPEQSDGTLDVYGVYPDEAKVGYTETTSIPRPDYTQ